MCRIRPVPERLATPLAADESVWNTTEVAAQGLGPEALRRGAGEAGVFGLAARQRHRRLGGRPLFDRLAVEDNSPAACEPAGAGATRPVAIRKNMESVLAGPLLSVVLP